jgi:hypothetical protein
MNNKQYFTMMWVLTLVVSAIMIYVGISLIPHFIQIGNAATIVVYVYLGCAAAIGPAFTLSKLYRWYHERHVITRGEVVATIDDTGKLVAHLSAGHEQAKQPRMIAAPDEKLEPDEQDIIDIYNNSQLTLQDVADRLGLKYNKVQKVVADAKRDGLISRK